MSRQHHPMDREKGRIPSLTAKIDEMSPLDIINGLMKRYCAVIEEEEQKGEAADRKRIDATLKAAAMLARGAAPYRHARLKPTDPPKPNVRQIIEVRWAGDDRKNAPGAIDN